MAVRTARAQCAAWVSVRVPSPSSRRTSPIRALAPCSVSADLAPNADLPALTAAAFFPLIRAAAGNAGGAPYSSARIAAVGDSLDAAQASHL